MDQALQYIYYTWQKVIQFLNSVYIDNANTVTPFYVIVGIAIISILFAYVLPIPRRNK